jgi:hypothetical protein
MVVASGVLLVLVEGDLRFQEVVQVGIVGEAGEIDVAQS